MEAHKLPSFFFFFVMLMIADYENFAKLEMRVGKIIEVNDFPEARTPAYKIVVDFGKFGKKKSSVQLIWTYKKDELLGKQVVAIVNFQAKQVGNFMSECLILGVDIGKKKCVLLKPEKEVELGCRVF